MPFARWPWTAPLLSSVDSRQYNDGSLYVTVAVGQWSPMLNTRFGFHSCDSSCAAVFEAQRFGSPPAFLPWGLTRSSMMPRQIHEDISPETNVTVKPVPPGATDWSVSPTTNNWWFGADAVPAPV